METLFCADAQPTFLGIFNFSIAPDLLLYAYIPIICISLLLGFFVLLQKSTFHLPNKLFFSITVLYTLYLLNEIMLWTAIPAGLVEFGWAIIALFYILIGYLVLYFTYTFLKKHDLPFTYKVLGVVSLLPIILLLPTDLNTLAFDIIYCESQISNLYYFYIYPLMFLTLVALTTICALHHRSHPSSANIFLSFGSISVFLILLLTDVMSEYWQIYEINIVSPLGMLLFMIAITYLIVFFKAFNIKLAAAQALMVGIVILIGSQFFFVESTVNYILVGLTFVLAVTGGYLLIKSVQREIAQREQLQKLTEQLARANKRLRVLDKAKSEFVSIASHQLRSPLTAMRGYASMLLEGSFGQIPQKARDAVERIADSTKVMANSIEDYLNVSRIESGNMKYDFTDFNFRERAERITDDKRPEAIRQGLLLLFKTNLTSTGVVHADVGKTEQIIHNLINNAMKYTEKGSITVTVRDDAAKKKIYLEVSDTGIGMSQETLGNLFGKFSRAKNAHEVNTGGTGLGLFVARSLAQGMKGDVTAASAGEGQGSTFTLELPLQM